MIFIIVKNETMIDKNWGGIDIPASNSYTLQEVDKIRFLSDTTFLTDLNSEDAVVNNGVEDLNPEQGLLLLEGNIREAHEPMQFSPAVGVLAPAIVQIGSGPAHGYEFEIDDQMFSLTHFDGLLLNGIYIQLHLCIDNAVTDRWIQFEFTILTTTGIEDRPLDEIDAVINTAQVEVPTNPFLIFDIKTQIPQSWFENGKDNLFIKIKRITAVGKTAPTNDPIVVRIDKIYKQRMDII